MMWFLTNINIYYRMFIGIYLKSVFVLFVIILILILLYHSVSRFKIFWDELMLRFESKSPYYYFIYSRLIFNIKLEFEINKSVLLSIYNYGWVVWLAYYIILCIAAVVIFIQALLFLLHFCNFTRKFVFLIYFRQDFELVIMSENISISRHIYRTAFFTLFVVVPRNRAYITCYFLFKLWQKVIARMQLKFGIGIPIVAINDVTYGPYTQEQETVLMEEEASYILNKWTSYSILFIFFTFKLPLTIVSGYAYFSIIMSARFIRRSKAQTWVYEQGGIRPYIKHAILHGITLGVPENLAAIDHLKIRSTYLHVNEFGQHMVFESKLSENESLVDEEVLKEETLFKTPVTPGDINDMFNQVFGNPNSNNYKELSDDAHEKLLLDIKLEEEDDALLEEFKQKYPYRYRVLFNPTHPFSKLLGNMPAFKEDNVSVQKWINNNKDFLSLGWVKSNNEQSKKKHLGVIFNLNPESHPTETNYIVTSFSTKNKMSFLNEATSRMNISENLLTWYKSYNDKKIIQYTVTSCLVSKYNINYENLNNGFFEDKNLFRKIVTFGYRRMLFDSLFNNKLNKNHLTYSNNTRLDCLVLKDKNLNSKVKDIGHSKNNFVLDINTIENYLFDNKEHSSTDIFKFWTQSSVLSKLTYSGVTIINPQDPTQKLTHSDIVSMQRSKLSKSNMLTISFFYNGLFNN